MTLSEDVCQELQRLSRASSTYLAACRRLGVKPLRSVTHRFEAHPRADMPLCTDPHCPVASADGSAFASRDRVPAAVRHHSSRYLHVCTDPMCTKRVEKHWFHTETHIHPYGMVLMLAELGIGMKDWAAICAGMAAYGNFSDLTIRNCRIDDASAAMILSALESQTRSVCGIDFFKGSVGATARFSDFASRVDWSGVKRLRLSQNALGPRVLGQPFVRSCFAGTCSLEALYLDDNGIGDAGARVLAECVRRTRVRVLSVRKNRLTSHGAEHLASMVGGGVAVRCKSCTSPLGLAAPAGSTWRCPHGCWRAASAADPPADVLCHRHGYLLGRHGAGGTWLCAGCGGVRSAPEPAPAAAALTDLLLRDNDVGDAGAAALAAAIPTSACLRSLELSSTGAGSAGVELLAGALRDAQLSALNINDNAAGDEGASALAAALAEDCSLTSLGCRANGIGGVGGQAISHAIAANTTLTGLDLCCNVLADGPVAVLTRALRCNSTLKSLDLKGNCLSGRSCGALAEAFCGHTKSALTHLDISENDMDYEAAQSWAAAIRENTTLLRLDLAENGMDLRSTSVLYSSLSCNRTLSSVQLGVSTRSTRANALTAEMKDGISRRHKRMQRDSGRATREREAVPLCTPPRQVVAVAAASPAATATSAATALSTSCQQHTACGDVDSCVSGSALPELLSGSNESWPAYTSGSTQPPSLVTSRE